jgi:hypothetical protein
LIYLGQLLISLGKPSHDMSRSVMASCSVLGPLANVANAVLACSIKLLASSNQNLKIEQIFVNI